MERQATDTLNLGQLIKESGDFGRFQFLGIAYFTVSLVVLNWSMMTMAFSATIPHYTCFVTSSNGDVTYNVKDVCEINGTSCDWFEFDPSMNTVVNQWELICDKKWITQTITTIQMSGLLVGGLFWGHVSDGVGRKPTLFLNILLLGVFNLVSYFSVNWEMFAAMRFCIGFCTAGYMLAPLMFEYIRNKWRMYLELVPGWAIWASLMAAYTWWLHDWRYIHVAIAAMSVVLMFGWFFLPESFRWLVSHGRVDDAENCITFVARMNRKPAPDLERLRAVVSKEQKEADETKALQVYTVVDLFRTSRIRNVTVIFSLVWIFSSYSYYGIAFGVQQLSGNLYLNLFLVSIVDIPGNYLLVFFNIWGGRKWTCIAFYLLGGIFSLLVGVCQNTELVISGVLLNVFALLAKLCVSAAWEINTIWSQESFPTVVRFIGGGFISSASRIGSMVAPQIITLSLDISGLLYLVSGAVCIIACVLCVSLDDTKNRDLPDMLQRKHYHNNTSEPNDFKMEKY